MKKRILFVGLEAAENEVIIREAYLNLATQFCNE
jgi:hypothetical protein